MNIAILVPTFPPAPVGGAQLQAEAWARSLSADHRITVVTGRVLPNLPRREERDGYTVLRASIRVPDPGRIPRPLIPHFLRNRGLAQPIHFLALVRGFTRGVNAIEPKPDVLLCFMTLPTGKVGVRVGGLLGIPAVVWIRGESDYRLRDSALRRRPSVQVWERAAGVLVQSEISRADFLAELGYVAPQTVPAVRDKCAVVENGIDLPEPSPLDADGPVVSVGRLVPAKGMDVVIDACAGVGRPLVIAGRGTELDALQERAAALNADVRFAGFLDRDALGDLYRQASVVVLASQTEGLPNVVLEAMAHGRPVVATPVGAIPDLIEDGVNGLLIPVGDTEALGSALKRLAGDPEFARRLGSAGRVTAERFAWEHVLPELEAQLERWRRP
jgi:glycosyltransferase involved in cell wall biosynthesis